MNKKICQFGLLTAFLFFFNSGCKKDDPTLANRPALHKLSGVANFGIPYEENGLLVFRDHQQYIDYQNSLENYIREELVKMPETDTITTVDDLLLAFETANYKNFSSFRDVSVKNFATLNATGWDRIDEAIEEHPYMDIYFESTLNQKGAVVIGDSIYIHPNQDGIIGFPKEKMDVYSFFNEMPGTQRNSTENVINWVRNVNPEILKGVSIFTPSQLTRTQGTKIPGVPLMEELSDIANISYDITQKDPCDPYTWTAYIFLSIAQKYNYYWLIGRTTIYWGDGTSEVFRDSVNHRDWHSGTKKHTYQPGTYHPYAFIELALTDNVGIGFSDESHTKQLGTIVVDNTLGGYCHSGSLTQDIKTVTSSDGKAEMRCKILGKSGGWANNIQAETEYWKKNSNGKWKKEKTDKYKRIFAKIEGRLSFGNCGDWVDKSKEELNTNKSSAFAVDRYGYKNRIKFNFVKSYHYLYHGNEKLELTQILPLCQ